MDLLNIVPLLSTVIGTLLGVFILLRKVGLGKDKKVRYALGTLVLIYALTCFDYYLDLDENLTIYSGFSYLFYHLIGYLFFYFIALFVKYEVKVKKWILIFIIHTLFRLVLLSEYFEYDSFTDLTSDENTEDYFLAFELDYLISSLINIVFIIFAFIRFNKKPLQLKLSSTQELHYKWIKVVIVLNVILLIGGFINAIVNTNQVEDYSFYLKIETLLYAIFFFVLAYSIMHFPVFAFTGNFEDLPEETKQKYVKSSLKDSTNLFNEIKTIVETEELYLDFDLKLNTLAEKLNKSVHHISQAINQNAQMSFPDFINEFRIEEAKKKLLESKPDTIFAISLDVGFNSKAAFYTAFKKFTNLTPTQFKRQNKQ